MPETIYILALAVVTFAFGFVVIAGPKVKGENTWLLLLLAVIIAGLINLDYIPDSPMNAPDMYGFFAILALYFLTTFAGFVIGRWWRTHFVGTKKPTTGLHSRGEEV